jgi:gentisate 1,2-dioxygenase
MAKGEAVMPKVNQVLKETRNYTSVTNDWEYNNVLNILIESGTLVMDQEGEYRINTGKYFGTYTTRKVK